MAVNDFAARRKASLAIKDFQVARFILYPEHWNALAGGERSVNLQERCALGASIANAIDALLLVSSHEHPFHSLIGSHVFILGVSAIVEVSSNAPSTLDDEDVSDVSTHSVP